MPSRPDRRADLDASTKQSTALARDRRLEMSAAAAAALLALLVYAFTLAPSITWKHEGADSGDLVTAAYTLGIPHPPGYPLFTLVAALFARLPWFEPAAGVAILAALAAACAVFVLARAGAALARPLLAGRLAALVPPLAALGFAVAPALWSQATIPEVYTLNLLFASVILWTMASDSPRRLGFAAAAFGLGLTHHLSILLLAPGALLALRPTRRDWRAGLLLLTPLLLYAYLPMRAAMHPPVNWGDPTTPDRFLWLVSAGPYRSYLFALNPVDIAARIEFTARLLFDQFTLPGLALALWGLLRLAATDGRRATSFEISFALVVGYAVVYASRDSFIYLLPGFAIVLLWLCYGAISLIKEVQSVVGPRASAWARAASRVAQLLVVGILLLLPLYNLSANFAAMDVSTDREAFNFARSILDRLPRDAVVFAEGDEQVFALIYYRQVILGSRSSAVIVSQGLLQYAWYYDDLRVAMNEVRFAPPEVKTDFHQRAVEITAVTFAEGRPVCFTDKSPLLPEFEYETRAGLRCVVSQRP